MYVENVNAADTLALRDECSGVFKSLYYESECHEPVNW